MLQFILALLILFFKYIFFDIPKNKSDEIQMKKFNQKMQDMRDGKPYKSIDKY